MKQLKISAQWVIELDDEVIVMTRRHGGRQYRVPLWTLHQVIELPQAVELYGLLQDTVDLDATRAVRVRLAPGHPFWRVHHHSVAQAVACNQRRRPRRLKCFINPVGGKREAPRNFAKAREIWESAGLTLDVLVTTRAQECCEAIQELDVDSFDAIVVAGGDGFLAEAVHGLMWRTDGRKLPIGLLPSGSTNTVAFSTCGNESIRTWAVFVLLGLTRPLDLCRVTSPYLSRTMYVVVQADLADKKKRPVETASHPGARLFMVSLYWHCLCCSYATNFVCNGFFSAVVKDSERYRWMGPARYSYSGFKQVLIHHLYRDMHVQLRRAGASELTDFVLPDEERVKLVAVALMPLRSKQSKRGLVPHANPSSGHLQAIVVRECGRIGFLRFLTRVAGPGTQWALDYAETVQCEEMVFMTRGRDVYWNIDGEIHTLPELTATALPGAFDIFHPTPSGYATHQSRHPSVEHHPSAVASV
ncbi:uncharacterized protein MONBRDRAFT_11991 [Monosiga brevicollis MX1]|uniref:DAGKc domain-containing protein n=1 Tax=Monosiga brevicollis TaxID=81824 RepID=A9VAW3_MONBE|nr:uncharacterized protein MONBRDRAFT_11991 [Monosiga brevicollis MX1]EDQ85286.1 predicted protein [Monosiga brevicollis MX1]|eukprot:XP_001749907.1 hypothetical protein [Monosiga brevicollis MX1]